MELLLVTALNRGNRCAAERVAEGFRYGADAAEQGRRVHLGAAKQPAA